MRSNTDSGCPGESAEGYLCPFEWKAIWPSSGNSNLATGCQIFIPMHFPAGMYWFLLFYEYHLAIGHVIILSAYQILPKVDTGHYLISLMLAFLLPRGPCHFTVCGVMKTKFRWQLNVQKEKSEMKHVDNDSTYCTSRADVSCGYCVYLIVLGRHTNTHVNTLTPIHNGTTPLILYLWCSSHKVY